MPEFILDKSGSIALGLTSAGEVKPVGWRYLPEGVRGYIEAAFFTDASNADDDGYEAFNAEHGEPGFSHLTPESLAQAIEDWEAFEALANADLEAAYERDYDEEQAGRDFWYTRNGHGVGFWDRDALEPDSSEYERLTNEIVANNEAWTDPASKQHAATWDRLVAERSALRDQSLGAKLTAHAKTFGEVYVNLDPETGAVHFE